jgi:uncharacterized membrane protein YebE (DUF533 family)
MGGVTAARPRGEARRRAMGANDVLSRILAAGAAPGVAGGLAGGLASGLLLGKSGRKLGKQALKLGGLAAIAGLAWTAWQRSQAQDRRAAPHAGLAPASFLPALADGDARDRAALAVLRAIIAAAHADGRLDGAERQAIFEQVGRLELGAEDKAALFDELAHPADLEALAAAATSRELAAEMYAASLAAIGADTSEERAWLQRLAERLALSPALVAAIHAQLAVEQEPEPAVAERPAG